MDYKNYQTARDLAWRALLQCNIRKLPVKVSYLCKQEGYRLYSYTEGIRHIKGFRLEEQCTRSDGFSTQFDDCYYIFYNPHMPVVRIRFTIAHEIEHIVLGHLNKQGAFTSQNREPGRCTRRADGQRICFQASCTRLCAQPFKRHNPGTDCGFL